MPDSRKIPWLRWGLALGWAGLIFMMSSHTGKNSGRLTLLLMEYFQQMGLDMPEMLGKYAAITLRKMAHLFEYGVLFLFVQWALVGIKRRHLLALVICCLYAASDEFHQRFVPGRVGAVMDVVIDTMGAALAWGVWCLHSWWRKRKG